MAIACELVLADAAIDDLIDPGLGIEGPFTVAGLRQREGERPEPLAEDEDPAVRIGFLDDDLLGGAGADLGEGVHDAFPGPEAGGVEAEQLGQTVEVVRLEHRLEGIDGSAGILEGLRRDRRDEVGERTVPGAS